MLNIIKKENYEKYYDLDIFKHANKDFENYLEKCNITQKKMNFEEFKVSTITCIFKIGDFINIKVLYEQIKIDETILYLEYNNLLKGNRNKKKINYDDNKDKRKNKKGKTFANQLSIGFSCKKHEHKKPICVKIFSKGSVTLTGVKDDNEINYIIKNLLKLIKNINTEYKYENKIINVLPYQNLLNVKDIIINIETVNGSFKSNFNINLKKITEIFNQKYNKNQIFIKNNRSALVELDLLIYKKYDDKKKKDKIPKVSIYGTGSIVLNSQDKDTIYKSYNFIKKFLETYYDNIVDKNYIFNL